MSKHFSKRVAMFLAVIMIICMFPAAAFAADPTPPGIVGYVMKDADGNLIQFMKAQLDQSMAEWVFNSNLPGASLYKYYRSLMADENNPVAYLYAQLDAEKKIIENTVTYMQPSVVTSAIMAALTSSPAPGGEPVDLGKAITEKITESAANEPPSTVVNGASIFEPPALDENGAPAEDVTSNPPVVVVDEDGAPTITDPGEPQVPGNELAEAKAAMKAEIDALIAGLTSTDYTEESWGAVTAAIASAKAAIDLLETVEAVEAYDYSAVETAIDNLVEEIGGDEEVTFVEAYVDELGNYVLVFSGELNETTANDSSIFTFSGGATGTATTAELLDDGCTVVLSKANAKKGAAIVITITGLRDADNNLLTIAPIDTLEAPKSNVTSLSVLTYGLALTEAAAAGSAAGTDILPASGVTAATVAAGANAAIKVFAAPTNELDSGLATANATITWRVGDSGDWAAYAPKNGIVVAIPDDAVTDLNIKVTAQDGVTETVYTLRITKGNLPFVLLLNELSAGTAGNQKITGLTVGKTYVVDEYNGASMTTYGVDKDGYLVDVSLAQPLAAGKTEILNLTNGRTYFVREMDSNSQIESFSIRVDGVTYIGEITHATFPANGTIVLTVPGGKDYTGVAPTIVLSSPYSTVFPRDGVSVNLAAGETYTVTAEDGSISTYVVSIQKTGVITLDNIAIVLPAPVAGGTQTTAAARTAAPYTGQDNKFESVLVEWYVSSSQTKLSGNFGTATQYEAYVTLAAKEDYKFTADTGIIVFEDNTLTTPANENAVILDDVTINTDAEKNRISFTVKFPATTSVAFAPVNSTYTVDSALDGERDIKSNGDNTFSVNINGGAAVVYNAGASDPVINQDVYALLQGLKAGDTFTFTGGKLSAVTKVNTADDSTAALNSRSTDAEVTITGVDEKKMTVTGTAQAVKLTGDTSANAEIDVSGLTASGVISTLSNASTITLGAAQRLTVSLAGVVIKIPAANSTTGFITLSANNASVTYNGVEIEHNGANSTTTVLKITNRAFAVSESNAATDLTIDAAGITADTTVNIAGVNADLVVKGDSVSTPSVLKVTGTLVPNKDVDVDTINTGVIVDISELTYSGTNSTGTISVTSSSPAGTIKIGANQNIVAGTAGLIVKGATDNAPTGEVSFTHSITNVLMDGITFTQDSGASDTTKVKKTGPNAYQVVSSDADNSLTITAGDITANTTVNVTNDVATHLIIEGDSNGSHVLTVTGGSTATLRHGITIQDNGKVTLKDLTMIVPEANGVVLNSNDHIAVLVETGLTGITISGCNITMTTTGAGKKAVGVFVEEDAEVTLTGSTVTGNFSASATQAYGLYSWEGKINVVNSNLNSNYLPFLYDISNETIEPSEIVFDTASTLNSTGTENVAARINVDAAYATDGSNFDTNDFGTKTSTYINHLDNSPVKTLIQSLLAISGGTPVRLGSWADSNAGYAKSEEYTGDGSTITTVKFNCGSCVGYVTAAECTHT